MLYTADDIRAQIEPPAYELGSAWFSQGRVSAPNVQRAGEIVTAVLQQPGAAPLRVYVRVRPGRHAPVIHGECTCPARQNCGHVAAVLLQALEDWASLTPAEAPSVAPQDAGGRRPGRVPEQALLYLVHTAEDGPLIETRVARRRDDGGYVLGRSFSAARLSRRAPPRLLTPGDLDLLGRLERQEICPFTDLVVLNGRGSDAVLEAMLATGRCHWVSASDTLTPLGLGPPRPLVLDWRIDPAGCQHLEMRAAPEAQALLALADAYWYIDVSAGVAGRVAARVSRADLEALRGSSPVAPERAAIVAGQIAAAHPKADLPAPRVLRVRSLPPVAPVPCLYLVSEDDAELEDYARLRFDYREIEVDWGGPDTRSIDGEIVRVPRDEAAEQAAVEVLADLGFEELEEWDDDGLPYLALVPDTDLDEPDCWAEFQIEHVPALREKGWRIQAHGFRWRAVRPDRWLCAFEPAEGGEWFEAGLGVEVDGERLDLLPFLLDALKRYPQGIEVGEAPEHAICELAGDGQAPRLVILPVARLAPLLDLLLELYRGGDTQAGEGLLLHRRQLAHLAALAPAADDDGAGFAWQGDPEACRLIERLRALSRIPEVEPPEGLNAALRPYQRRGLDWLQFLREYRFGGILADDMGLGKTLQALAHVLLEKAAGRADRPSLVVAPTSLMFNWFDEARRFAPALEVLVLHGPARARRFAEVARMDLVLTTYPLLARDREMLTAQPWHLLILDEVQVIRNPTAQAARVVRTLEARHRVGLTGTPMENHLGDLWALFDVLLPGLLGDARAFRQRFRTPIEKHSDEAAAERLRRRIRPFLLRRTKQQVATELPEKNETVQRIVLEGRQRELYETVRLAMHRRVSEEIERQGIARSHIVVLDALLKLRQVCCDPRLMPAEQARGVTSSAKLDALMTLVPEMVEEGRRILLFSQFTTMLALIEDEVCRAGIGYVKLTGRTRNREQPVERFQRGEVPLFLISLKAGGVGLNLTAADTVIHYDPWWNPAVERQATDRAHRIGQRERVFVYKLLCEGTVEEKIYALQRRKQSLADGLYHDDGSGEAQWTPADIDELFGPMAGES
jgi:superfamily II DNA or RNA helicase